MGRAPSTAPAGDTAAHHCQLRELSAFILATRCSGQESRPAWLCKGLAWRQQVQFACPPRAALGRLLWLLWGRGVSSLRFRVRRPR